MSRSSRKAVTGAIVAHGDALIERQHERIAVLERALRLCEQSIGYMNPKILELGAGKLANLNHAANIARKALGMEVIK